jgi:hypothetical protein
MRRRLAIALTLGLVTPALAEEPTFVARDQRVAMSTAGLLDELRVGLQYERGLAGTERTEPRWRGWKLVGLAGAGLSSIGAGHQAMMEVPSADGAAVWIATRAEYVAGGLLDGMSGELGFGVSAGPVVNVVDEITRIAIAYRPGIVMRMGRFHFAFSIALEHDLYAWSDRTDLVEDGWIHGFTPGFEVGLGVAF